MRTLRRWTDGPAGHWIAIVALGEQESVPDRVELEEIGVCERHAHQKDGYAKARTVAWGASPCAHPRVDPAR
jgi:hypothetical protein